MLIKRSPYPMIEIGFYDDTGSYIMRKIPLIEFYQGDDVSIYIYVTKNDQETPYDLSNSQLIFTLFKGSWKEVEDVISIKEAALENPTEGLALVNFSHDETLRFNIGSHRYLVRLNSDGKSVTIAEGIIEVK